MIFLSMINRIALDSVPKGESKPQKSDESTALWPAFSLCCPGVENRRALARQPDNTRSLKLGWLAYPVKSAGTQPHAHMSPDIRQQLHYLRAAGDIVTTHGSPDSAQLLVWLLCAFILINITKCGC